MSVQVEELWQVRASCRGPQAAIFFPPSHFERKEDKEARERRAKAICQSCPVRKPCLEYALTIKEPHGIWGGLNEMERKPLLGK
ncbi:MAG TPA: WhiB family transcriptional regulator [Acidimicrobiales bacterium]|nr:WhiB family transcriptional regulator [Acidimicrobiales bacterium]